MKDARFEHVGSDPRFKKVGKKKNKVKIDERFLHMFTSKKFNSVDFVDKRGRKDKIVTKEKLEKFYEIDVEKAREDKHDDSDKEERDFLKTQITQDKDEYEDQELTDSSGTF